jgi:hypothetical protein
MNFEIIVYRTYATTMKVWAPSQELAEEMVLSLDCLNEIELEQCNIVETSTEINELQQYELENN